uniref:Pr1-like protein n=1 Tax=Oryza glaberrima TaxID=4538 RepID=A0A679BDB9_ORYGL|nr:pr1-like protein [Oryza glaberrima]
MAPARFAGQIHPFECERERKKWGERERGSRGVIPPTLLHARTAGCGGFGGGGGAWRGRSGGSGGRSGMTGGPHPSARVAGGPARQRRARGEGPSGPRGEKGDGDGNGPSRPKGGEGDFLGLLGNIQKSSKPYLTFTLHILIFGGFHKDFNYSRHNFKGYLLGSFWDVT